MNNMDRCMTINHSNCVVGMSIIGGGSVTLAGNIIIRSLPEEFALPSLSETFTGRDEEMQQLASLFFNEDESKIQNKVVICGVAGIGKSELAKQFAKKYEEEIQRIYWINSENEDKLQESIKTLHKHSKGKKCLFILDNVVSKESIAKLDLHDEYFYLITSQNKDWGDIKIIELNQFSGVPTCYNENLSSNPTTDN